MEVIHVRLWNEEIGGGGTDSKSQTERWGFVVLNDTKWARYMGHNWLYLSNDFESYKNGLHWKDCRMIILSVMEDIYQIFLITSWQQNWQSLIYWSTQLLSLNPGKNTWLGWAVTQQSLLFMCTKWQLFAFVSACIRRRPCGQAFYQPNLNFLILLDTHAETTLQFKNLLRLITFCVTVGFEGYPLGFQTNLLLRKQN